MSPDWSCGGEAMELLHFTIPQNKLKSQVFPFKLQYKNNSNRLSNLLQDHLSFTVAANYLCLM